MSIKFGWSGVSNNTSVETDPFNGAIVLTLKAFSGGRRQCIFSPGAINAMGLWRRTNGLEEQPEFSGMTISKAHDDINNEYFLFVNDGKIADVAQIKINKTNCGLSDKELYMFLVKTYNLNDTVDNHILLTAHEQSVVDVNMFKINGVYTMAPQEEAVVA